MKTRFKDRHDRVDYLKTWEIARRIVCDPPLIEVAQNLVTAMMTTDPQQRSYATMWSDLPRRSPRR